MEWLPTSVSLPREFHGQGSLAGYSPWGPRESDTTEQLTRSLSAATLLYKTNQSMKEIKKMVLGNSNAVCQAVYMSHIGRYYIIPNLQMVKLRQGTPK